MTIDYEKVLSTEFDSYDLGPITVRDYFKELLLKLWSQGEGFSGKRPFGNSGWDLDLARGLIKSKAVKGKLDEDGFVEDVNDKQLTKVTVNLIQHIFKEPNV